MIIHVIMLKMSFLERASVFKKNIYQNTNTQKATAERLFHDHNL